MLKDILVFLAGLVVGWLFLKSIDAHHANFKKKLSKPAPVPPPPAPMPDRAETTLAKLLGLRIDALPPQVERAKERLKKPLIVPLDGKGAFIELVYDEFYINSTLADSLSLKTAHRVAADGTRTAIVFDQTERALLNKHVASFFNRCVRAVENAKAHASIDASLASIADLTATADSAPSGVKLEKDRP